MTAAIVSRLAPTPTRPPSATRRSPTPAGVRSRLATVRSISKALAVAAGAMVAVALGWDVDALRHTP
jgi:hypothetical protein